jgi:hypothetical protein
MTVSKPTISRLDAWMDDEVAPMREYDPRLDEAEYREALSKTLHAAQLRLADDAGALLGTEFGDRVYSSLKEHSDRLRDRSLREWFRRHW